MENLEKNIKNKLMEIGMTISDLATKSDLTKQTIHNIFNTNDARMSQLEAIANEYKAKKQGDIWQSALKK